jgi:hypothetical protein
MVQMLTPGSPRACRWLGAALVLGTSVSTVSGQWAVIDLHPAQGAFDSFAVSVQDGKQVGYVRIPDGLLLHASLWSGSAASWVDLHPPGAMQSVANAVANGQQGGWSCCFPPVVSGGGVVNHPVLWNGTAASWTDLSPTGSSGVVAAMFGGLQVGTSDIQSHDHAGVWAGTAASWLDLHPASTLASTGVDTDGTQQVGYALIDGNTRASLWSGSAGSWVNLHPNAALASRALSVNAGQQVGWASYPIAQHAHLWKGTKNSLVDLHPAGASQSRASGVHAGQQVGTVNFIGGGQHAGLWSGTAASWLDLHTFLPPEFIDSEALDIWHSGNTTYVVGNGFNAATMRHEALLWLSPPPAAVWTDLGSALPGVTGLPELSGTGTLVTASPMSLSLSKAAPSALALLFVAVSSAPTPFKGGSLVPVPPLYALSLATSASGVVQLASAAWPPGASGFSLYFQCAIQDASAVHGAALSNALRADVP